MTHDARWTTGDLYLALVQHLPTFVDNPFSTPVRLNVGKLREALKRKSTEGIYKWLRSSKLTPAAAEAFVELANSDQNLDALKRLGRTPPKIADFTKFVFA